MSDTLWCVLHSFSIKNIFYDKMDLRLFYFDVAIFLNTSFEFETCSVNRNSYRQCSQEIFYMIWRIESKIHALSNLCTQLITAINLKLIMKCLCFFFTILRVQTNTIKNSNYHLLKYKTLHIAIL